MATTPASSRSIADALMGIANRADIQVGQFKGPLAPESIKASKVRADTQIEEARERRRAFKTPGKKAAGKPAGKAASKSAVKTPTKAAAKPAAAKPTPTKKAAVTKASAKPTAKKTAAPKAKSA